MNELSARLAEVRGQLETHRELFAANEAETRRYVVDPILEALGWRGFDRVRIEQTTSDGRPDYTLLHANTKMIHVEAKAGAVVLTDDHRRQLARYCYTDTGVPYGVLTNGHRWIMFEAFRQGLPFADRVIWDIDLLNIAVEEAASAFSLIAYDAIEALEPELAARAALSAGWLTMWDDPSEIAVILGRALWERVARDHPAIGAHVNVERAVRFVAGVLPRERVASRAPSPLVGAGVKPPQTKPAGRRGGQDSGRGGSLRGPGRKPASLALNGASRPARWVKDILVETAEWLIGRGELTMGTQALLFGPSRYTVCKDPTNANGKPFGAVHQLSNGLYLDTKFNLMETEKRARALLEHFGHDADVLSITWTQ